MRTAIRLLALISVSWVGRFGHAQTVLFTVDGAAPGDTFGQSTDIIGDANGDGMADVLVGAWRDDTVATDAGSVRVFSGADASPLYAFFGTLPGDHMGFSSCGAGDIDGDGLDDICAAADEADIDGIINAGACWFVSSATGIAKFRVSGDSPGDLFGWSTSIAGDVDADGFVDVAVGILLEDLPGKVNCGSAVIISGAGGGKLLQVFGANANDNLGYSVSGGDVNNDGFADLVATAPAADFSGSQSGMVTAYSGIDGTELLTFFGNSANDNLGRSVSARSDVDADGYADVIVGAETDDVGATDNGSVFVLSGRTQAVLYHLVGDAPTIQFGSAVAGVGDVDGDGCGDFLVGTRLDDLNGVNSGSAKFYTGHDGMLAFTLVGDNAADQLGTSVSGGGDINGDGFLDILAGAVGDDNGGAGSGSARAYSLVPKGIMHIGPGTPSCFGPQVINVNKVPQVGDDALTIFVQPVPASSHGLLLIGEVADRVGSNVLGGGTLIHVAFPPIGTPVTIIDTFSDGAGNMFCPFPTPNDPSIIGAQVTMQHLSQWPEPCPELGILNVSSSFGMTVVIQP